MGEKKVFTMSEIKSIIVPKLDEMSMVNMVPIVQDDDELKNYFPDEYFTGKMPDREFFFNTINTMHPGFL